MQKPKGDGRCIHCRQPLVKETDDHVFPASWYPDSTPQSVQRWTAPSCPVCNGNSGKKEQKLFIRLALCIDPRKIEALGISTKLARTFGIGEGVSPADRQKRTAFRDRILSEAKPISRESQAHIIPGLGPHSGFPERRVAVTVIREDLVSSAEAAERFRQEARAAASFAHPNVVTVHDFGVAAGTRAFLVMEILQGSTLRERLRLQKHLPPADVLSIIREVAAALAAAHRRQLVHRDLKPENIFLVAAETGEVTKVLDFGLAKFVSNPTQQRTVDTASGAVLGTPRYMSPEQRRGEAVHQSWDLWALGVLTYEMVMGAFPFENTPPGDWFGIGSVVLFTPVAKCVPEANSGWQELFDQSFARELSRRHESADAFLCDLQHLAS